MLICSHNQIQQDNKYLGIQDVRLNARDSLFERLKFRGSHSCFMADLNCLLSVSCIRLCMWYMFLMWFRVVSSTAANL